MTDTANAPERIWTADTTGNCSVGFNTPSLEYKNEYISRTHCDELVAAAYLDAAQVLEDEIDLARIALPQAVPVLRADIRAIKNRTPTKAMAALTAYGERMKAEGASEAQAKIARLTEALTYYNDQFCEGFCSDVPAGFTNKDMENDCSGCRARAALQENANG
jgi:hypothetical protein